MDITSPALALLIKDGVMYPKKANNFSPKKQMIVAYHNTHVVHAYKGLFNRNIGMEEFYWTLKRLWTSAQWVLVFSQLLQLAIFPV